MTPPVASRIDEVLACIRTGRVDLRLVGAPRAARALIAVRIAQTLSSPLLILCPSDEQAAAFLNAIEALSLALDGHAIETAFFPTWEQSLYNPVAPSIRTRLARAALISRFARNAPPKIVLTSLAALAQTTVPRAFFARLRLVVEAGNAISSREAFAKHLIDSGYLRVDPVEDPGTFAVRGEIVDVFPPDRQKPVRIELFGDQIERIREFDPATQRTAGAPIPKLEIFPARELLVNTETASLIRERVKTRADNLGIPRAVRDPIMGSLHAGVYPDHADAWAPFAYPIAETAWDHLPEGTRVIWDDESGCEDAWKEFIDSQLVLSERAPASGLIIPPPEELFLADNTRLAAIRAASCAFFDEVSVGNAVEPLEVSIENNADLTRGSRHSLGELEHRLRSWINEKFKIVVLASGQGQVERIRYLLEERNLNCRIGGGAQPGIITLAQASLSHGVQGFRWVAEGLIVLTDDEILGSRQARTQKRANTPVQTGLAAKDWAELSALSDLAVGDAVVHIDHGVGRYLGLVRLALSGAPSDFLMLEYANRDKLYLPIYRLNVVQKYVGGDSVTLDRLGAQHFAKAKEKVKEAVRHLAIDLVKLYAERKIRPGIRFSPRDSEFREFEAGFPFEETPDQLRSIDEILRDLESGTVMDRLVCGDVGYGKTEVAIRAAFRAVTDGRQVAVLVPTTVLAFQHEQSFRERLKDYPVRVESVSRFKSRKDQLRILRELEAGKIDILIGTHRLLSRDVRFRDLGLLVVDEEHRFGVEHKEKLKAMKVNTHVLTLTATPIPRTLHMALSGLRDISLIRTPPVDRLPIRTYVSRKDEAMIQTAIRQELQRGGQVFYLHNRVQSIHSAANALLELVPEARIGIAHGQMSEQELEKQMLAFYQKQTNVLVCTTIIESGLDLPSANTIIIERADTLGLAQLYQIRGRVGRGQERAYAYLLIPEEGALSTEAKQRLGVIQRFVDLGSGFSIANHDLEIRGGGDLLGAQQSGHIAAVGFELYTELLEEAIHELKGQPTEQREGKEPEIKIPFAAYLDDAYIPDVHQRLALYRRFSAARNDGDLDHLESELLDRFGPLPPEAHHLLWLIRIKLLLKAAGIEALTVGPRRISLQTGPESRLDPVRAVALVASRPGDFQLLPDSKFVAKMQAEDIRSLFFSLETLVNNLKGH